MFTQYQVNYTRTEDLLDRIRQMMKKYKVEVAVSWTMNMGDCICE